MKLYNILFLNESQIFASQAYKKGFVIIAIDATDDGLNKAGFILLNKNRIKDENGKLKAEDKGEGIVYGSLDIVEGSDSGFMQTTSADAIHGYGPLLYQTAMYYIEPNWLESHESLTDSSYDVWNKMYELSEKGVYIRKYIGNNEYRHECANVLHSSPSEEEAATEESFLAFLTSEKIEPEKVGCYWAYKKTSHEPEIAVMLKEGKELAESIGEITKQDPKVILFNWMRTANLGNK